MVRYEDSKLLRVANLLSTLISSALPVGSILALNYIDRMIIRLVVIGIFTMIFSLVLSLITNARKVEVFAATTAYVDTLWFVATTDQSGLLLCKSFLWEVPAPLETEPHDQG